MNIRTATEWGFSPSVGRTIFSVLIYSILNKGLNHEVK